jgi:hypothetical protein
VSFLSLSYLYFKFLTDSQIAITPPESMIKPIISPKTVLQATLNHSYDYLSEYLYTKNLHNTILIKNQQYSLTKPLHNGYAIIVYGIVKV